MTYPGVPFVPNSSSEHPPSRIAAGNREHTLKGSISGSKMTGAVETTMFGSVASGDLDLTKM